MRTMRPCRLWVAIVLLVMLFTAQHPCALQAQQKAAKGSKAEALWQQAMIKMGMRDLDGAIADITNVIALTRGDVISYYLRGLAYTQDKRYPLALADLQAACKLNRMEYLTTQEGRYINAAEYAMFQGLRKLAAGNDSAVLDFSEVLRLTRANGWAYWYRGLAQVQKRPDAAFADIQNAAELGIADAQPMLQRLKAERQKAMVVLDADFPKHLQLYPRDAQDSATVRIAGRVNATVGFKKLGKSIDSVVVETLKNGVRAARVAVPLVFAPTGDKKLNAALFAVQAKVHAELSEYSFRVVLVTQGGTAKGGRDTTIARADSVVCGDVIAVCGEANALVGNAPVNFAGEEFARTYCYGAATDASGSLWQRAADVNKQAEERVGGIGGEVQRRLILAYRIPICIVNAAVASEQRVSEQRDQVTIENFLPPVNNVPNALYNWLVGRMQRAGLREAVRAIVWYHGETNPSRGYAGFFRQLYEAWSRDFPRLQQVYVMQHGPNICGQTDQHLLREAQRRLPETIGQNGMAQGATVKVIPALAAALSTDKCRLSQEGCEQIAQRLASQIGRDFYTTGDSSKQVNSSVLVPKLSKAVFANSTHTEIALVFAPETCELSITPAVQVSDSMYTIASGFSVNSLTKRWRVVAVRVQGNVVTLTLNAPCMESLTSVSYPATYYPHPTEARLYEGPWIVDKSGMPAPAWFAVPVEQP